MSIDEIASLVTKAVSEHAHTKALRIKVIPENNTIRLLGQCQTYFQKSMLLTVVRKVCPTKELVFNEVIVGNAANNTPQ